MIRTTEISGAVLTFFLTLFTISPAGAVEYAISVDGGKNQGAVPHFWSRCVGTGGADLCLREDWRNAAKIGVAEAGFKAFRGHGILHMSDPVHLDGSGNPVYDWTVFDRIYDYLVDTLGTVPLVELSFMPGILQTVKGDVRCPPNNWDLWKDLIRELVLHCNERYGKERVHEWLWEVWNEPNFTGFWIGNEQEYFKLYKYAAEGAKSADPEIIIGGPSTTTLIDGEVKRFLDFCRANNTPVDMVTNHCYSDFRQIGGTAPTVDPVIIRDDNRQRVNLIKSFGKNLLSVNSEYTSSYAGAGGNVGANTISMDSHVNAPFVAKCVKLLLDDHTAGTYPAPDVFSYWTISDVFDEGSYIETHNEVPFAQVFGLINYQGVRKATFNAFKLLNMMGTTRLELTGGRGEADGVDGFATVNEDLTEAAVMVYNFYRELGGQTASDEVTLTVKNLPFPDEKVEVIHYRIDSTHANAYGVWLKQGKPDKPTPAQWDAMHAASELAEIRPAAEFECEGTAYTETFSLPRQGVSLLLFRVIPKVSVNETAMTPEVPAFTVSGGRLRIRQPDAAGEITLSVYSLNGKLVKKFPFENQSVDMRKMIEKPGVYMVRVQGGKKTSTVRISTVH